MRCPTPGGTLLFITTTRLRGRLAFIQPSAAFTWLRSAAPLSEGGVPVAMTAASPRGSSHVVAVQKPQIAPANAAGHARLQPRLVQRNPACLKRVDPAPVDVHAQHVVARRSQPGGRHRPNVTNSNYGYLQPRPFLTNRTGGPPTIYRDARDRL